MTIPRLDTEVPWLDTDQMIAVDRAMIQDYGIDLVRMMENAGRSLAIVARDRFLGGLPIAQRVTVLAGSGGNGGGALVAARRLQSWGAYVRVLLAKPPDRLGDVPRHQLGILVRMGVKIDVGPEDMPSDDTSALIIDGLIGYSLKGAPYGITKRLIKWANEQTAPVLALDTPSGIDTTTGTASDPAIRAAATMTLALPKEGLRSPGAKAHVGELYLADISVPPTLYAEPGLGLNVGPIFAASDIVRLS